MHACIPPARLSAGHAQLYMLHIEIQLFAQGPSWLMGLVVLLTSLWFINFGAVMTWQTSLYYWHRQEEFGKGF